MLKKILILLVVMCAVGTCIYFIISEISIEESDIKEKRNEESQKVDIIDFCGVKFGLNVRWDSKNDNKPYHIALLSSKQDIETFDILKEGISKIIGNPFFEDYSVDEDHRVYGRVKWDNGYTVILRTIHSDEGGIVIFVQENTAPQAL